ncbi:MAG TPA: metallophosphoesterase [Chryseolinea sp.]|nr:metallophosphoesterase [Chryseolinea sp.]
MRNSSFLWVIIGLMLLMDIYVFQAVKIIIPGTSHRLRTTIFVINWTVAGVALATMLTFPFVDVQTWPKQLRTYVFSILVGLFFSKLVASIFFLIDDIRRGGTWLLTRMFSNPSFTINEGSQGISRSVFLSWIGVLMGGSLFSTLIYGFKNKYNYRIRRVSLNYPGLPKAFRGMRIVQLSDIHSGSFMDKRAVTRGVETAMKEKPDLILFTGDLVNDRAVEMNEYLDVFNKLNAPMGVYSILGNHDYGDYVAWSSQAEKTANLDQLKNYHAAMGWRLLMNQHVLLKKGEEQIALIGIENWSAKARFPKYGKLKDAYAGTEQIPFKILMSHDPSHWDAEVRTKFPDIDLMLAGHTHGMQFGVDIPGFKWSPVQYMYKQWADLYEEGSQKLYVNRGFGFIGYPGRVGILPEITVITLT